MSSVDEWIAKYMVFVDRAVAMVPYGRASVWKEFFFSPVSTVSNSKVSKFELMKELYIMIAISMVISLVAMAPAIIIVLAKNGTSSVTLGLGIIAAVIAALFILAPIFTFLYSLLEYAVAKALGGVGDIDSNFNASVLPSLAIFIVFLPIDIIDVPVRWISYIPIVNICGCFIQIPFSIIKIVASFYTLYLKYAAFKEVHKLTTLRAIAVVFVPMIVMIVLLVAVVLLFYAILMAWVVGSGLSGMTGAGRIG